MEEMDEYDLTEDRANSRKRTQALRLLEINERELEESRRITAMLRRTQRVHQRDDELQNMIEAIRNADLAVNVFRNAMAYRKQVIKHWVNDEFQQPLMMLPYRNMQRTEEFKFLLSHVSSDEEKLRVQSRFDDFLKTKIPFTSPSFDVATSVNFDLTAYAVSCSSDLFGHLQRSVSQKQEQEHSLASSACEDADHSSVHGKEQGLVKSMSVKLSKKSRRKWVKETSEKVLQIGRASCRERVLVAV